MGLFDFLKKKATPVKQSPIAKQAETNSFGERFDKLTAEGDLPFGWVYHHKEFTDKIQSEYSYFLNTWLDARSKSPKEQYAALKSFILYLEDLEKLCKSKGECFEFWFYDILSSKDYIEKREKELRTLAAKIVEKS